MLVKLSTLGQAIWGNLKPHCQPWPLILNSVPSRLELFSDHILLSCSSSVKSVPSLGVQKGKIVAGKASSTWAGSQTRLTPDVLSTRGGPGYRLQSWPGSHQDLIVGRERVGIFFSFWQDYWRLAGGDIRSNWNWFLVANCNHENETKCSLL